MSIAAIPNSVSTAASAANPSSNAPAAQPSPQPEPAATSEPDTVQLTEAQQVYQLYNQGQQVPQIADTLRLSVAAVNGYLNLSSGS
jgi:DNA-binding NarL/FixJ family response regulator